MEFNELEEMLANRKVDLTLKSLYTNLQLVKKEDRPANVKEKDWIHDIKEARNQSGVYLDFLSKEEETFSELNLFKEVKEIDSEMYRFYLNLILKGHNKFGVLF